MGTGELLGKPKKLRGSGLRWTSIPHLVHREYNTPNLFISQKPGKVPAAMS